MGEKAVIEPKPCPFCDNEKIQQFSDHKWGCMLCLQCSAQGPEVHTWGENEARWREAAITEWNRRAGDKS
jgi:hypothetical protein